MGLKNSESTPCKACTKIKKALNRIYERKTLPLDFSYFTFALFSKDPSWKFDSFSREHSWSCKSGIFFELSVGCCLLFLLQKKHSSESNTTLFNFIAGKICGCFIVLKFQNFNPSISRASCGDAMLRPTSLAI